MEQERQIERYIVNPSMSVIRSSDNELIVRSGSRSRISRRLKDELKIGILGDLAFAFMTPTTVAEGLASVEVETNIAKEMFNSLVSEQVLIREVDAEYAFLTTGLGLPSTGRLVQTHIQIIGDGKIATALNRQLTDVGCQIQVLSEFDETLIDDADFIIAASDTPNLSLFFDVNEAALSVGKPWHAVCVDGAELVVGPLFIPGLTASFYDFDAMDESARSLKLDYMFYKSHIRQTTNSMLLPTFVADLAASYTVASSLQHLAGHGSFLEGHVIRIDLERLEIIRDQVMQLPRHPAGLAGRPDLRHPFL